MSSEIFQCRTCTWQLVRLCYGRALWFRLVREPLVLAMRALALWHGIDGRRAERGHPDCRGCVRYLKNRLKERSPCFRWLNACLNPAFNGLRDAIVSPEEIEDAQSFARHAAAPPTSGQLTS